MAPENTPRAGWVAREATEPRAGTTKVRQIALDMMSLIDWDAIGYEVAGGTARRVVTGKRPSEQEPSLNVL